MTYDDVLDYGLTLPDTVLENHYCTPSVKTNGRAIVGVGREAGSFLLMIDLDTIEMLKETDPDTYWQTPHYVGWPGVLVRFDTPDPERVYAMIDAAHSWARSRPKPRPRKKA
jgi:hypothetical protein